MSPDLDAAAAPQRAGAEETRRALWLCLAVAVAYLPLLRAGFVWDDASTLTGNPLIRAGSGLYRLWFTTEGADYWPVTSSSLWIEWRLWGLHALGYHLTNLALHVGNTLLIWAILQRLRVPGAYLAALLFAVHPLNVEAVAWIAQRKTLLATFFFLVSIACFLRSALGAPAGPAPPRRWYWLSLGAFTLGMLSKGSVAPLPLVLVGLIAWVRPRRRSDGWALAPFFLVGTVLVAVDVWFQQHGTAEVIRQANGLSRTLGAAAAVAFYLSKSILPVGLAFVYPLWVVRADHLLWWLPLGGVFALTWFLLRRVRSRGPRFAWGYFCLMLFPVMGFTDVYYMRYSLVAEHYAYLAVVGVAAGAAAAWAGWQQQAAESDSQLPRAAAAAAVALLMAATWGQAATFRDARTLFAATLRQNPDCWMAHNYLGALLFPAGQRREAIDHLEAAVRLKPDYAEAHFNLGNALSLSEQSLGAVGEYEQALKLKPAYREARFNLANELAQNGQPAEAIAQYQRIERENPRAFGVENNLGNALAKIGRPQEAILHFEAALRIEPGSAPTRANLGNALAATGQVQAAIAQYEQALQLDPGLAKVHYYLSQALRSVGRTAEADAHLDAAMLLSPRR
jgi:tetratricopeptide (TPR) repeat protein